MKLYPYQQRAIEALRDAARAGSRRMLLVAPTGAGKTTIASHVIRSALSRGSAVQFWAHRTELISQCSARLDQHEVPHGVVQGGRTRGRHNAVQVVSVPTLVRRLDNAPPADLVIVDEAHRSVAGSYVRCLERYPRARVIGLTATPYRTDGTPLGDLYDSMAVVAQPDELVAGGWLMEPTLYAPDQPDMDGVAKRRGDWTPDASARAMKALSGNVVTTWQRLASSERTVVFACNVGHSRELVERFVAAGARAEHVDGETPAPERDAILRRLRTGETQIVSNVGILTEGWDLPDLGAVVLARPTQSCGLYLQMVGRVLRVAPGKSRALVVDHGGNIARHGPPTWPRTFDLHAAEGEAGGKGPRVDSLHTCGACFAVWGGAERTCPACGWEMPPPPIPEEVEAEVIEYKAPSADRAIDEIRKLRAIAQARGYADGWVAHRYKARYGSWPSRWLLEAAR
ncbi:MAG: DEAD/DEAH box helicase [Planctomycetota bacterium]